MQTLNPYTVPLESINLIEASAGTGKSWTVTLLYLRLILEKGLTVDQILVVTFTDAATKELRDAVRERLVEALDYFQAKQSGQTLPSSKQEYAELYKQNKHGTDKEAIQHLNLAKLSLDEAAILTIHSFCQRVLNENAFEAGLPFESELMDDDYDLMLKLTDDYWRRKFQHAPQALLFKLNQKSITPDSLLNDIRGAVGKPYLEICGPNTQQEDDQKWKELDEYFQQAIDAWTDSRDDLITMLSDPDREDEYLKYIRDHRDEIFAELDCLSCAKQLPVLLDMTKMSWIGTKEKTYKKFESINPPFCKKWQCFLDLWKELNESSDDFLNQIRIDLLQHLQQELPKEKQRFGVLSFDDLLLQLQQALQTNEDQGKSLAEDIRNKYKAALIDEFQDTDPIQYDIFSRIYKNTNDSIDSGSTNNANNNTVFLVGDPKQAIYSFRGGDIHTYIKAKSDTLEDNRYTLNKNWRSHASLISAFNALYQLPESNPFQDDDISYINVDAGDRITDDLRTSNVNNEINNSALRFWQYDQTEEKPSLDDIRNDIATAVAGDITRVLNVSNEGNASIGEKPITGGDIAVLVRSHYHGDLIKAALSQKGVASVQSSKDSIFETQQASEIIRLLTAIIEPQREDDVRRALVTELMGRNADDLIAYEKDGAAWEDILQSMFTWHYQWKQQGFLPMMRSLMKTEKLHQHLLGFDDGERRLTNLLHLSEIIHQQSRQQSLSMEETVRWLKQQQEGLNKGIGSTQKELRLESDENLVKIVTIHKSKGLEYPIIYCPFVGLGAKGKALGAAYSFYDDEKACLEIGSADADQHKDLKRIEEKAEDTRLLYVALTRAKYQCTVVSFDEPIFNNPDRTALGWLISNGQLVEDKKAYYEAYKANLEKLAVNSHGNISVQAMPVFDENLRLKKQQSTQKLSARAFTAKIKSQIQITSFSGLTAGAHVETADHDSLSTTGLLTTALSATAQLEPKAENEFPRGPTAGNALHEIYENLDFKSPVGEQKSVIKDALNKWGFDKKHEASAQVLIEDSLETSLFESFSLDQLSLDKRLNEMEFYLPLEPLQIDDLKQILFKHLPEDQQAMRDAVDTLYFDQVEGYLKGFIDLIFEYDGQYYVADYKSNSLMGYDQESLKSAMASSHYYLQYLLYSVALHRYLQKRIPDYSWQTHVGGVTYLFIRGMSKNTAKQGVYFDKPSAELIEALDKLFVRLPAHV
ncbi:MAG TPA: exodeoxyribonuclease V subunit beta [Leucothrix mucor]|nr:exodeoxyribonuclease V subunit beta [Leucothrix mucor]